jgi:ABC-type antimicrobial peptide transport system permease subunit
MTVLAGRLPAVGSTGQTAMTPSLARTFGVGVGGRVTYQLYHQDLRTGQNVPAGRVTFPVTAIVDIPPAVLSLALTVLSLVRRRRGELALLKALGMTRRQLREIVAWQTTLTLVVAVVIGVPLGVAGGRWAWHAFAGSLGVVPVTVIPLAVLVPGAALLLLAGNLLTLAPATVAARTTPAAALRAE